MFIVRCQEGKRYWEVMLLMLLVVFRWEKSMTLSKRRGDGLIVGDYRGLSNSGEINFMKVLIICLIIINSKSKKEIKMY